MKNAVFALCCLPILAFAQELLPDTTSTLMASVEGGVICAPEATGETSAPGTIAGTTHLIADEPPFVAVTRRVPAVMGIGFGMKAQAAAVEGYSGVFVTVTHPPMGPDGVTSQSYETLIRGTDTSLTFYQFDYDYELVTGFWQFEATTGGTLLYRATFEVLPAEQVPELAEVCNYAELLS